MLAKLWAIRIGVVVLTLGFWQIASAVGWADPLILPPPATVFATLVRLLGEPQFVDNALTTFGRILTAFAIGVPISVLAGFAIAEHRRTREAISPLIYFLMGVPQSIFLPIFIQLFGLGFLQKVVFGVTHIFFVLAAVTIAAARSTAPELVLATRSFGAGRMRIYRSIYMRSMLPVLINGFRLALIFSIIGILSAEMFAARSGLGQLMMFWGEEYRAAPLMAGVLLISVVTIALNEAMTMAQRALTVDGEANAVEGTAR